MLLLLISLAFHILFAGVRAATGSDSSLSCRSRPEDKSFPTTKQLSLLNSSIGGRLMEIIPSGQFCQNREGGCSDAQWADALFKADIPGAMIQVNWEQDYASNPPSLCFRNSTPCGQGSVPIYGINATTSAHIQVGVRFAQEHNLKVVIKASGHDFLGRSTAQYSFLLWTRHFQDITFHDMYKVAGKYYGSAVTVGSGVGLHVLYQAAKSHGKIFVGGQSQTVVPAGGYIQGAGHSALSPKFGLAADNTLEFEVVIANGSLVTANEISHPDLFWALRGGGAGSWGVIVSATFRTFPTFDVVVHQAIITANSSTVAAQIATLQAQHTFDWDALDASQYFYVSNDIQTGQTLGIPVTDPSKYTWSITTYFPNASLAAANASIAPFLNAVASRKVSMTTSVNVIGMNDALSVFNDVGTDLFAIGSRLIPADVYRYNAPAVGETYKKLFDAGTKGILGIRVAGGQVSRNAGVKSAVHPNWRAAKAHVVIPHLWNESTSPEAVEAIRLALTHNKVPILDALAGPGSASYSNEADVREPNFQKTFFGSNYARLSAIKDLYDPHALFIVGAGVGSEKWDSKGMCRVA